MIGITSYGCYIPRYRLRRDLIAEAHGGYSFGGEKSVANYDEDALTMAYQACFNCILEKDPSRIGGLYFASTSSPFREKMASPVISAALNLSTATHATDFAGSLRSGANALISAFQAVKSEPEKEVLVVAAENRLGEPGSDLEQRIGDGAGAILVGTSSIIASLEAQYSISDHFTDYWRLDEDRYVKAGDQKFINAYGYEKNIKRVVKGLLDKHNIPIMEITRLVLYSPDNKNYKKLGQDLGFEDKCIVQDTLFDKIGDAGCALSLILLASALEEAKPGEKVIFVSYGDGAVALLFEVQKEIERFRNSSQKRPRILKQLGDKKRLSNYQKYLRFKDVLKTTPTEAPWSSLAMLWNERDSIVSFKGMKCNNCSAINFPIRQICPSCRVRNNAEKIQLSHYGKLFTYTHDRLFSNPDPPLTMVVVDLAGGGRVYTQMTDCNREEVRIGMPVCMTLRKFHQGGGFNNYFWKARPIVKGVGGENYI